MDYSIGIDLGGTNIKAVAVTPAGQLLRECSRETEDTRHGKPAWPDYIARLLDNFRQEFNRAPSSVGLCAPGLASQDGRSIAFMPGRMAGLEGLDWTTHLRLPTVAPVLNDAQAALLGEVWQGAAVGATNVVLLTLGTGVGGAIFADGRLLKGQIGRAGHLGHMGLDVDGAQDSVGIPGSLEEAIAEKSIRQRSDGAYSSTKHLVEAVAHDDAVARAIWERSIHKLACAIASLINIIDPEMIIIGGGIAKAGDELFQPLRRYLDRMEWRPGGHRVKIVSSQLGEWSGAYGAAYNAIQESAKAPHAAIGTHTVPQTAPAK